MEQHTLETAIQKQYVLGKHAIYTPLVNAHVHSRFNSIESHASSSRRLTLPL